MPDKQNSPGSSYLGNCLHLNRAFGKQVYFRIAVCVGSVYPGVLSPETFIGFTINSTCCTAVEDTTILG